MATDWLEEEDDGEGLGHSTAAPWLIFVDTQLLFTGDSWSFANGKSNKSYDKISRGEAEAIDRSIGNHPHKINLIFI